MRVRSAQGSGVSRRDVLKGGLALGVSGVAARSFANSSSRTLRFVHSNLSSIDPVATGGYPVRNFAYMVFDTLYAMDTGLHVHPQMAAGHEVSADGKIWTITLRDGLKFHDGEPVRGVDSSVPPVLSSRRYSRLPSCDFL